MQLLGKGMTGMAIVTALCYTWFLQTMEGNARKNWRNSDGTRQMML